MTRTRPRLSTVLVLLVLAGFVLGMGLAGCQPQQSGTRTVDPEPTTTVEQEPIGDSTDADPTQTSEAEEPDEATEGAVGNAWLTYQDDLKVRVTKIRRARLGPYDTVSPGMTAVVATVQIRNDTKGRVDPSLTNVTARYGANGDTAESGYLDQYQQINSSALAPGKMVTGQYVFEIPTGTKDVTVEVAPGYDYRAYAFTGKVRA